MLDEATANIDMETDNLIQHTLRNHCKDCTVLVVAHRLATVIDSDRILLMSDGEVVEYNHPFKLLTREDSDLSITRRDGYFGKMILANGEESAMHLFKVARDNYLRQV